MNLRLSLVGCEAGWRLLQMLNLHLLLGCVVRLTLLLRLFLRVGRNLLRGCILRWRDMRWL